MVSYTEFLQEEFSGKLNEEGNLYIRFIHEAATRMRLLVVGLVEYSILGKAGAKSDVDCNQLVSNVLTDLEDSIRRTDGRITVGELPVIVGLENELRLLFQNLINNALKFTKTGDSPEIFISAEQRDANWEFSISDNGIGIDERQREKIFIMFKRLHNRNDYEGTGIGLAHCKKIVELHEGKIWVESKETGGSTFKFTFPIGSNYPKR